MHFVPKPGSQASRLPACTNEIVVVAGLLGLLINAGYAKCLSFCSASDHLTVILRQVSEVSYADGG